MLNTWKCRFRFLYVSENQINIKHSGQLQMGGLVGRWVYVSAYTNLHACACMQVNCMNKKEL